MAIYLAQICIYIFRRRGRKSDDDNLEWPSDETASTLQPGSRVSWFNKCVSFQKFCSLFLLFFTKLITKILIFGTYALVCVQMSEIIVQRFLPLESTSKG